MTSSLGVGGIVGVEKINWVVVNGFEISRWKVPWRWAVINLVTWGFLSLLLPPQEWLLLASGGLLVLQKQVLLGERTCLSLDWLFPGVIWQKAPRCEGYNPRNLAVLPHFPPEGLIFLNANQARQCTAAWKQILFFLFLAWNKRGPC